MEKNVIVVDSIMGAGKTSWLIQNMNQLAAKKNYMYVTPFLKEITRVKESVKIQMSEPLHLGKSKEVNLCELVQQEKNIACTHQLLKNVLPETMDLIAKKHYVLVLDEVMEVFEPLEYAKDTVKILQDADCITIDENKYVIWNPDKKDYQSEPKIDC